MRRLWPPVLAGLILSLGLAAALPAQTLEEERAALRVAKEQAAEARQRSADLLRDARDAREEAERLKTRAAALASRIQESEADLAAAKARIAIVERLQLRQRARLAARQKPIVRLTAALQMMARQPTATIVVRPGSLEDFIHVRAVLSAIMPEMERKTADLRAEIERGRELRRMAGAALDSLRASRIELAERRREMKKLEAQRRIDARRYTDDAGLQEERAIALGEDARDIADLLEVIQEQGELREALAALEGPRLRPADPSSDAAPVREGRQRRAGRPAYRLPAMGEVRTGFGELSATGYRSRGLTIAVQPGAQVVAPAGGTVAYAGDYKGYGDILIIEHGSGWTSLVTDLAELSVTPGMEVVQGEPVGRAANEEPRITVELRRNGRPIDIAALVG